MTNEICESVSDPVVITNAFAVVQNASPLTGFANYFTLSKTIAGTYWEQFLDSNL